MSIFANKNILIIITGGIAAYKSLEVIRYLKKYGAKIRTILTKSGREFVTPISVAALSGGEVYEDLFSLKDETQMGHIRLSREADIILIIPATANFIAKISHGMADDLASTVLLANQKTPVLIAPAMNPSMWNNPITQDNITKIKKLGAYIIEPQTGEVACGETGKGKLAELENIYKELENILDKEQKLVGKKAIVTAGPTYEKIDPVRFIGNHSSGKQGIAIAEKLRDAGAEVTLILGPGSEKIPDNINTVRVRTANEMLEASLNSLPSDIAIFTAAVADWKVKNPAKQKIKKSNDTQTPIIELEENPDILKTIANLGKAKRPQIVMGFAAETEDVINKAKIKLKNKNCDFIIANDVREENAVFGGDFNQVSIISKNELETLPKLTKLEVASKITDIIINHFEKNS